jgi:hypothetical protein
MQELPNLKSQTVDDFLPQAANELENVMTDSQVSISMISV